MSCRNCALQLRCTAACCTPPHAIFRWNVPAAPFRLVEQSDYESARDLFGASTARPLESYLPKTVKDFEELAAEIVNR